MKATDFEKYTDEQLIGMRLTLIDGYDNYKKLKNLPSNVYNFVLTENSQIGNVSTRINRCISCLHNEAIRRFFKTH